MSDLDCILLSSGEEDEASCAGAGQNGLEDVELEGVRKKKEEGVETVSIKEDKELEGVEEKKEEECWECVFSRCEEEKKEMRCKLAQQQRLLGETLDENYKLKTEKDAVLEMSRRKTVEMDDLKKVLEADRSELDNLKKDVEAQKVKNRRSLIEGMKVQSASHQEEMSKLKEAEKLRREGIVTRIRKRVSKLRNLMIDMVAKTGSGDESSETLDRIWEQVVTVGHQLDGDLGGIGFVDESLEKFKQYLKDPEDQERGLIESCRPVAVDGTISEREYEAEVVGVVTTKLPIASSQTSSNGGKSKFSSVNAARKKKSPQHYCFSRRMKKGLLSHRQGSCWIPGGVTAKEDRKVCLSMRRPARMKSIPARYRHNEAHAVKEPKKSRRKTQVVETIIISSQEGHVAQNNRACSCGKVYSSKRALDHHIKIKTRGKAFQCEICQKSYVEVLSLRRHTEKCHGERYSGGHFSCLTCCITFHSKLEVYQHQRLVHKPWRTLGHLAPSL